MPCFPYVCLKISENNKWGKKRYEPWKGAMQMFKVVCMSHVTESSLVSAKSSNEAKEKQPLLLIEWILAPRKLSLPKAAERAGLLREEGRKERLRRTQKPPYSLLQQHKHALSGMQPHKRPIIVNPVCNALYERERNRMNCRSWAKNGLWNCKWIFAPRQFAPSEVQKGSSLYKSQSRSDRRADGMQQAQQLSSQRRSFWSGKNRPGEADKLNICSSQHQPVTKRQIKEGFALWLRMIKAGLNENISQRAATLHPGSNWVAEKQLGITLWLYTSYLERASGVDKNNF